jgi:hypothetical protein
VSTLDRVCRRVLLELHTGSVIAVIVGGPFDDLPVVHDGDRAVFAVPRRKFRKLVSKGLVQRGQDRRGRDAHVITEAGRELVAGPTR